jgi:hypothetical protein
MIMTFEIKIVFIMLTLIIRTKIKRKCRQTLPLISVPRKSCERADKADRYRGRLVQDSVRPVR